MRLLYIPALLLWCQSVLSQTVSFGKLMSYFISADESKIKADLKIRKFIVEKERVAEFRDFYDTQINCYNMNSGFKSLQGVIIFKKDGGLKSLSYFTLNKTDFSNKVKEIHNRGFELATEDTIAQWYYTKDDTIVAVEKKIITSDGKDYLRYEIGIAVELKSAVASNLEGYFSSKYNFHFKVPDSWIIHSEYEIDKQKINMDKISNSSYGTNMNIQLMASPPESLNLELFPKLYATYTPLKSIESLGFQKSVKIMLSDEVNNYVYKKVEEIFPEDLSLVIDPNEPYIDKEKRLIIRFTRTDRPNETIICCNAIFLQKNAIVQVNFYAYEEDMKPLYQTIRKTLNSFIIDAAYRLKKD